MSEECNNVDAAGGAMPELPYKILIGTHHKTGTVWLKNLFDKICEIYNRKFYMGGNEGLPGDFDVFLHDHSAFDFESIQHPYRGIHIIRDPRDIIISGCFYHQKSEELWLRDPIEHLGGKNYHELINGLETEEERLLFEMKNLGLYTLREIMAWDYSRPEFMELKYEDLIVDTELELFRKIFVFLGLPDSHMQELLAIALKKSLFCGKIEKSVHIRSGETAQWRKHFTPALKEQFLEMFGDVLIKLGYEKDNGWEAG